MDAPNITKMSAQVPLKDYDRGRLEFFYETMLKIRKFECSVEENFLAGNIPGFVHLYIGEEAIATGVMANLTDNDYIESTHRGHGHTDRLHNAERCGPESHDGRDIWQENGVL